MNTFLRLLLIFLLLLHSFDLPDFFLSTCPSSAHHFRHVIQVSLSFSSLDLSHEER
jgi:hypothetical protein